MVEVREEVSFVVHCRLHVQEIAMARKWFTWYLIVLCLEEITVVDTYAYLVLRLSIEENPQPGHHGQYWYTLYQTGRCTNK